MTGRRHIMPFGAELIDHARVRFGLWAPGAGSVALRIEDEPEPVDLRMAPEADGWFGLRTRFAGPGSRYRYRIDGRIDVPDPASRFQPADVHGPSEVIEPGAYRWHDDHWRGRPWAETVLYELHVGSFSPAGTFAGVRERLDDLAALGVTAIELMPVADFPGARNWGYDGVLPFAPDSRYGRPEDLKQLVDAAHARGLMVFLDVVYNHFGPDGNYLPEYAPAFFSDRHQTPWGAAINVDGPGSAHVRAFFIHNALYWLEEYHLDGLRLDAVDTIADDSPRHFLTELADTVRRTVEAGRHVHLVLENDRNQASHLARDPAGHTQAYDAQWDDDLHHAAHLLLTGEHDGYYADYADGGAAWLGRCLAEGFAYQGEASDFRGGRARGEPSGHLPPTAFVAFLQNHDQVGNRAFGERLTALAEPAAVRAATAMLLLAPQPPLLFMGQEWAADQPFPFFCDFGPQLAAAVTEGRRGEFASFPQFADPATRERIPDPNDPETFTRAVLDWAARDRDPHADWLAFHRELLDLRRREIVPRLAGIAGGRARYRVAHDRVLVVEWSLGDGSRLALAANLGSEPVSGLALPAGRTLYAVGLPADAAPAGAETTAPPWSLLWRLDERPVPTTWPTG